MCLWRATMRHGRILVGHLCGLLPYAVEADQTADRAGKTDNAVVEVDKAEGGGRNSQIAQVGDELELSNALVPVNILSADSSNAIQCK